jgi:hypothetical protein
MKRAIRTLLICVGFMGVATPGLAQSPLTEDEAFQFGVEAYVYGYALLVMDSVRAASTAPDREFILMLRLCWPKDEAVNGRWAPPAVKRVEGAR